MEQKAVCTSVLCRTSGERGTVKRTMGKWDRRKSSICAVSSSQLMSNSSQPWQTCIHAGVTHSYRFIDDTHVYADVKCHLQSSQQQQPGPGAALDNRHSWSTCEAACKHTATQALSQPVGHVGTRLILCAPRQRALCRAADQNNVDFSANIFPATAEHLAVARHVTKRGAPHSNRSLTACQLSRQHRSSTEQKQRIARAAQRSRPSSVTIIQTAPQSSLSFEMPF